MKYPFALIVAIAGFGLVVGGCEAPGSGPGSHAAMLKIDAVCDVSAGSRAPAPATPGEPVRYRLCAVGTFNLGEFPKEESPRRGGVAMLLRKSLLKRGYAEAGKGSPPAVVLMAAWGRMATSPAGAPGDRGADPLRRALVILVSGVNQSGAGKREPVGAELRNAASVDRYYLMVAALDVAAAGQGRIAPYWCARISTEAEGFRLEEVLPTLIDAAGPVLGVQTGPAELRLAAIIPEPEFMARRGSESFNGFQDLRSVEDASRNHTNFSGNYPSTTASPAFQH